MRQTFQNSHSPRIVVITPTKNEEKLLSRTLTALQKQILPPCAIIIVDGGSVDHTVEVVERFARDDPRIILIRNSEPPQTRHHKNIPRAFNEGLRAAPSQWDYLAKVDADTVLEPAYFEKLVAAFQEDPKLGIAGGQTDNAPSRTVRGGNRVFRRRCWEAISESGLMPIIDSEDTYMDLKAEYSNWHVRLLPDAHSIDLRTRGQLTELEILKRYWQLGVVSYMLGYHPLFFVGRMIKMAMFEHPRGIAAMPLAFGWVWAFFSALRIDEELRAYQRTQQAARLSKIIKALTSSPLLTLRKVRHAQI
jgi:biofilm PGA synthesis N-glycosyltransferase PgaC